MQNPLFSNKRSFVTYVGIWILVIFIHILLLMITEQVSLAYALADGFISNVIYAAIGLGLWFPIFFTKTDSEKILSSIINHLICLCCHCGNLDRHHLFFIVFPL